MHDLPVKRMSKRETFLKTAQYLHSQPSTVYKLLCGA